MTYSTTNVNDIIKPNLKGADASAALSNNPTKVKRVIESAYKTAEQQMASLVKNLTPGWSALYDGWKEVKWMLDNACEEDEETVDKTRTWADKCLKMMKEDSPVMTGKLRESIRIIGSSALDIDVRIDEELISKPVKMKNIVPYVDSYDKWLAGEEKARPIGSKTFIRDYDYSDYADNTARPKNWWKGGTDSLYHFKSEIWRHDIKELVAEQLGLPYGEEEDD